MRRVPLFLKKLATGCALFLLTAQPLHAGEKIASGDWAEDALRLTGEAGDVRANAIKSLKANMDLKDILKSELQGPRFALALDVVTALNLHAFLPGLLRVATHDETGAFYLAINSLAKPREIRDIAKTYRERLVCGEKCDTTPFPSRIVMLDTLGRLGNMLTVLEVENLIQDDSFEVRASALAYARLAILRDKKPEYMNVVERAVQLEPYQLRLQALHLISEMDPATKKRARELAAKYCDQDNSAEVRAACKRLLKGGA